MDIKKSHQQFKSLKKISLEEMETRHKVWIGSYSFFALVFLAAYFLLRLHVFNVFGNYLSLLQKISLGGFFGIVILMIGRFVDMMVSRKSETAATRYNLIRLIRLLSV